MKLDDNAKRAHAVQLFNDPLFIEIMDGMERAAIQCAIHAAPTDNDARHAYLVEARAIQSLRVKLKNLAARGDTDAE